MAQPTYQDRVEAQGNASVNCPTSSRTVRAEPSLTWAELVALEPRLAAVEKEARRRRKSGRAGDASFYGFGRWHGDGLKDRIVELVGWCRRSEDWADDLPDGLYTAWDLLSSPRAVAEEDRRRAAQAEDEAAGRGVLWSCDGYDIAYNHVLHLCWSCRRRCCRSEVA